MTVTLDNPAAVRDYLLSFDLWKGPAQQEGINYLNDAFQRLLTTLSLVPPATAGSRPRLLELGANPYFMTLLLRRFRPEYELCLANYFGAHFAGLEHRQTVHSERYGEEHDFNFLHFNIELEAFPYPDEHVDFVLYCEIIEHLTVNPTQTLNEIHRVLKPGGHVLITTPNVHRLQNILGLLAQHNLYDPYSGYGPYGRHNREYTPRELVELAEGCGYAVARLVLEEKYAHPAWQRPLRRWHPQYRDNIYLLAKRAGARKAYRPDWLYRSFY